MAWGGRKPVCRHKGVRKEREQTAKCFLPTLFSTSPPNTPHPPLPECPNISGPGGDGGKGCGDPRWTPSTASSSAAFVAGGQGLLSQQPLHPLLADQPHVSQSPKPPAPIFSTEEESDPFLLLFYGLLSLSFRLSVVVREGHWLEKGWGGGENRQLSSLRQLSHLPLH